MTRPALSHFGSAPCPRLPARGRAPGADPVEGYANYNLGFTLLQLGLCGCAHVPRAGSRGSSRSVRGRPRSRAVDQALATCPGEDGRTQGTRAQEDASLDSRRCAFSSPAPPGSSARTSCATGASVIPDDRVVALDLLTYAGVRENLRRDDRSVRRRRHRATSTSSQRRSLEHEIDVVVNFAAESHNSLAVLDPGLFARTNVVGTQLSARGRAHGRRRALPPRLDVRGVRRPAARLRRDVHARTRRTVRGRRTTRRRPRRTTSSARTSRRSTCRSTITNCSNNYGPFQFPEKVIPLFVTNALDDKELPLYASTQNRREWLHVRDHCRAIELVLARRREGETYNVGSGVETSIEEIADGVLELTGKPDSLKTIVPDRPGHDRRYLLDSSRLRASWAGSRRSPSRRAWRRRSAGTRRTARWWEPLKERLRSQKPPGAAALSSVRRWTCLGLRGRRPLDAGHSAQEPWPHGTCWASDPGHVRCRRLRQARGRRASAGAAALPARCAAPSTPDAALGCPARRSRSRHPAVEAGLLEDRLGELGPRAVAVRRDVVDAVRQLEQRAYRFREMADVRRRAALVVDDGQLVALRAEPEHRPHEVLRRPAEEPRACARSSRSPRPRLAVQLRAAVGRQRAAARPTRRTARASAVEDVVGREVDDRRAERRDVRGAADVDRRRALRIVLGAVDVRPGRGVQHEVVWCDRRGRQRDVPLARSSRATASGNASESAAPSWPSAPVMRIAARSRSERIGAPCSTGARRAGRPTAPRARPGRPGRTPRSRGREQAVGERLVAVRAPAGDVDRDGVVLADVLA